MTIHALITGKLHGAPVSSTSRNGNAYTRATLAVVEGNERRLVALFVFSESAQAELARLGEGDALSVQGQLKAEIYAPEGKEASVSLSLTADVVLPLRAAPKPRTKKEPAPADPPPAAPSQRSPERGFKSRCGQAASGLDDSVTFAPELRG
jgi:hypothetical protein